MACSLPPAMAQDATQLKGTRPFTNMKGRVPFR